MSCFPDAGLDELKELIERKPFAALLPGDLSQRLNTIEDVSQLGARDALQCLKKAPERVERQREAELASKAIPPIEHRVRFGHGTKGSPGTPGPSTRK